METTDQVGIRERPPHIRTLLYTLPYIFGEVLLSTDHCNRFATRPWQGHPNTLASIPLRRRCHPDRGSPPSRPPPRNHRIRSGRFGNYSRSGTCLAPDGDGICSCSGYPRMVEYLGVCRPSRPPPRPSHQTFLFPMPRLLLRCSLISCFYDISRLLPLLLLHCSSY